MLKMQLAQITDKLTDTQRNEQAGAAGDNSGTNPFLTNKNRFFDNYARDKAETVPGIGQSLATPNYGYSAAAN